MHIIRVIRNNYRAPRDAYRSIIEISQNTHKFNITVQIFVFYISSFVQSGLFMENRC